jgi:DNA-binding transcriptional regulator YiaG
MDLITQKPLSDSPSPKARGARVRHIRETVLRYSRRKFGEKYAIPAVTIQNWESGKYGGLTEKGALKLMEAFQAEGAPCSVEWLLYGIGAPPASWQSAVSNISANQRIAQELGLFRQLHPEAVDAIVADNSMEPGLQMGDIVAGERYFAEEISKAVGQYCIVQLTTGEVLIREFWSGNQQDQYVLTCLNPKAKIKAKKVKANALFSVAPIIWIRRKISDR